MQHAFSDVNILERKDVYFWVCQGLYRYSLVRGLEVSSSRIQSFQATWPVRLLKDPSFGLARNCIFTFEGSATCQALLSLRPLGTVSLASWRTVPKFAQKLRLNVKLCMARGSRIQECTLRYRVLK